MANLIGGIVLGLILYYIIKIVYKKINPKSDCSGCSSCDQNCPFANFKDDEEDNKK